MESELNLSDLPGLPVLVGIGGSHAYGLATPESDIDYRGCYVAPTRAFFGLTSPEETYDRHDPDMALHEVGKLLRLAMSANPTVLELFFYDTYVAKNEIGDLLIANRDLFITSKIRATHMGFAMSQLGRLKNREDSESPRDKRVSKHARHLLRLIQQAERALSMGVFDIRVADREEIFAFGQLPYDEMVRQAQVAVDRLETVESVLPAEPDIDAINDLLVRIRTIALDW
jgi:predicted nucleotidyltransferase